MYPAKSLLTLPKAILLCCAMLIAVTSSSKAQLLPPDLPQHDFINYSSNVLHYDTASPQMKRLFQKWRETTSSGGTLHIVHIGGSHVQAGALSNTIRTRILAAWPNHTGDRGMIFPYSAAAKCNNPADYRIHCREKMLLTRCVYHEHDYPLGACGIAVTAADTLTEIQVLLADTTIDYRTSRIIVIGHSEQEVVPTLSVDGREVFPSYVDRRTDRFVYNLTQTVDSFAIHIPCQPSQQFTLTGIYLGNRQDGISFSSLGVNGAAVGDFLRCRHLVRDLRLMRPDVVLFGIGINDAVPPDFDTAAFRQNYLSLIDSIRAASPDCTFIFITNNDSYRKTGRRKYSVNRNGLLAREVFYRLAHDTGGAVWDQFEVMGGLRSMDRWRQAGLARTDRVHFTAAGYRLLGHLFCNALFNALQSSE